MIRSVIPFSLLSTGTTGKFALAGKGIAFFCEYLLSLDTALLFYSQEQEPMLQLKYQEVNHSSRLPKYVGT